MCKVANCKNPDYSFEAGRNVCYEHTYDKGGPPFKGKVIYYDGAHYKSEH